MMWGPVTRVVVISCVLIKQLFFIAYGTIIEIEITLASQNQ